MDHRKSGPRAQVLCEGRLTRTAGADDEDAFQLARAVSCRTPLAMSAAARRTEISPWLAKMASMLP